MNKKGKKFLIFFILCIIGISFVMIINCKPPILGPKVISADSVNSSSSNISGVSILDDFNDGNTINLWNGENGQWGSGGMASYESGNGLGGSGCLKVAYDMNIDWIGAYLMFGDGSVQNATIPADVSSYEYFSFWVKSSPDTNGDIEVSFKDDNGLEVKLKITNYLTGGTTNAYQQVIIPLSDYSDAGIDLTKVLFVLFIYAVSDITPTTGDMYFDDMGFSTSSNSSINSSNSSTSSSINSSTCSSISSSSSDNLLDDFDDGNIINLWNGENGQWGSGGMVSYDSGNGLGGSGSLKAAYDGSDWLGAYLLLGDGSIQTNMTPADISAYDYFSFWVKSIPDTNGALEITMKDDNDIEVKLDMTSDLIGGTTGTYKEVMIPLSDYSDAGLDLTKVLFVLLGFDSGSVIPSLCDMYFDDMGFDNYSPEEVTVNIISPSNGSTVSDTVEVTAIADASTGILKVEFYIDGTLEGSDFSDPYSYSWNTTGYSDGSHSIKAIAHDYLSNTAIDDDTSVTVDNSAASTVSVNITGPTNGETVSGSSVVITADANSDNGILRVEFFIDDEFGGLDFSHPYSYNWNTTGYSNGSHSIKAIAYDNSGDLTTDDDTSVTVDNLNAGLLDDFDDGGTINLWGGEIGQWGNGGTVVFDNSGDGIGGSGALRVAYNVTSEWVGPYILPADESTQYVKIPADVSTYDYFSFWVKSTPDTNGDIEVSFKDDNGIEVKLKMTDYLTGGTTGTYQEVIIPLSDYSDASVDLTKVIYILFIYDPNYIIPTTGNMYFDDMEFGNY